MLTTSSPWSPVEQYLKELHQKHAGFKEGIVADYIPELAKANPDWFGICIATRDGHVYEVGDTRQHFTIQSISKALAYGLALEDRGEEFVLSRISVEPSGDAFNAISLKPGSGAPFNPMINAGAIATDGQVLAKDGLSRIQRILAYLSSCAGRSLDIDQTVYKSESETGHRNRAIGWMLRNFGIIEEEPTEILESYFQQCSIRVTCRDLAIMGATLANQGRNPLTREQAIAPDFIDNILSVMSSCGMYDFSGEWLYRVGLPAKSGVGGGILAVLPGQLGIGIFSPPLDEQGNSARGIRVCADLSHDLGLHVFGHGSTPQTCLRLSYDGSQVTSRRHRSVKQQNALRSGGHRLRVLELQGVLIFSTFEPIIRNALKQAPYCRFLILNLRTVMDIDDVSIRLLVELQASLKRQGVHLITSHAERFSRLLLQQGLMAETHFSDADSALEYCENRLLYEILGKEWDVFIPMELGNTSLLSTLNEDELNWLNINMDSKTAQEGDVVIRAGDAADALYLLMSGSVAVYLPSDSSGLGKRLDVFVAGMTFGEMGLIDGSPRSANVVATEKIELRVISRTLFEKMDIEKPIIKIKILESLSCQLSTSLRRSNAEAAAYKG